MTAAKLAAISRPNGKLYRPRRLRSQVLGYEDEAPQGLVVFGTHDPVEGRRFAEQAVKAYVDEWYGSGIYLTVIDTEPVKVWYGKSLSHWDSIDGPRFNYFDDPERGAGGLLFALEEHEG